MEPKYGFYYVIFMDLYHIKPNTTERMWAYTSSYVPVTGLKLCWIPNRMGKPADYIDFHIK